jgi:hypothetical protein
MNKIMTIEEHSKLAKLINACKYGKNDTTPKQIFEDMIPNISEDILKDPKSKYLDPCCGIGTSLVVLYWKLREYHTHSDIINNMLYGADISEGYTDICKEDIGLKNIYNEDALKKQWNMKFDVVIGNPPYQDSNNNAKNVKLWTKFTFKAIELSKQYIAFVTPNNAIKDNTFGTKFREKLNNIGYGFIYANNHKQKKFNASIDTCDWIISRGAKDNFNPIGLERRDHIIDLIIDKVISYKDKLPLVMQNGHISKDMLSEDGINSILFSGNKIKYTNFDINDDNKLKVVFPFSCSYKSMFITVKPLGMLNLSIDIKDQNEGEVIMSYANSKLLNFVANRYNKTSGFTPFVKANKVPDLRRQELWTDEELYKHFNLTQEEIDYIESSVK